ncbi:MAG: DUF4132 domain-containing protein [Firmicutes bacterium]|nr:DUF4132 domain-containing protein [Bacillota bacterium]
MQKLSNEERARLEALAKQYGKKADEKWQAAFKSLTEDQRTFLSTGFRTSETYRELSEHLQKGKKPSEFFEKRCKWLFDRCILKRHKDGFLYTVDNCTAFIFQLGWARRTFRSADYSLYADKLCSILQEFTNSSRMDVDFADFLENNLSEEQAAYKSKKQGELNSYLLAYEIDRGNGRVINYVKRALESGSDTAVSYSLLTGVFLCKNTGLYDAVCRLLLAARLQEGLRQAICENSDGGRIEPFIRILKTIRDNDLIRYSSVKRAVGCFAGLMTEETRDLERISGKTLDIMVDCLESGECIDGYLQTEDSMRIYMALWAASCREFRRAERKLEEIIEGGTAHQAMTAGIFLKNVGGGVQQRLAVKAVLERHDEPEVMAVFLPQSDDSNFYYSQGTGQMMFSDMSLRYDRPTAERLYAVLNEMLEKLPKDREFAPCVFPWNAECLTRSDIVKRLCVIASDLDDMQKIDEACVKIPLIKGGYYYGNGRVRQIRMLLRRPRTQVQLDALVSLACDKEEYTRKEVFEILNTCSLQERHFRMLEDMLKYKAADMRRKLIEILLRQPEEQLFQCVGRLCSDKKEEKRTAGLDMIISINESDTGAERKARYAALGSLIQNPASPEKILLERLYGSGKQKEEPALYSEADDFVPQVDEKFIGECKAEFVRLFPATKCFGNRPLRQKAGLHEILEALDRLIEEHKNDEYIDARTGEPRLLAGGTGYSSLEVREKDGTRHIAFPKLWDGFYKTRIHSEELLLKLDVCLEISRNCLSRTERNVLGEELAERHSYMHPSQINRIIRYFRGQYLKNIDLCPAACALGYYLACEADAGELYDFVDSPYSHEKTVTFYFDGQKQIFQDVYEKELVTAVADEKLRALLLPLHGISGSFGEHYRDAFSIKYMLAKRFGFFDVPDEERYSVQARRVYVPFTASSLILAAYKGIVSQGFLYKMLLERVLPDALEGLSQLISYLKSGEAKASSRFSNYRSGEAFIGGLLEVKGSFNLSEYEFTEEDNKKLEFAAQIGQRLIDTVLKTELVRGDSETRYSRHISSLKRIYGAENFVKVLAALGKDTLERSTWLYTVNGASKKQSLSYLLGICVPDVGDDGEKLKGLISGTDITESRLVEAALFSHGWIPVVEEYLGWEGFQSACYYFIAHMNESLDERTQAVIARYSPISAEDLNVGAFDINWFRDALQTIGENRFDKIYKAAKYISSGAKHTRARKYADAVMGRLSVEEAVKNITEKRNKDTLMAYALIPLVDENDMVERYLFIQEFKKQSRQFGAQRRVSETAAADCALQNLSKNAGFSDVERLTLRMEAKLFENIRHLLEWKDLDEIRLKLEIGENGSAEIKCEKDGRPLKAVPAKYKKNELVTELAEKKKLLNEQYRRTCRMLEEAMEGGIGFTQGELNLLCTNPTVRPVITRLVYKSEGRLGFLQGNRLVDHAGAAEEITEQTVLKVAHPFDIYRDGHWHEYQKYLFDNEISQPFKQVFRELYIKTTEEEQAFRSTRYAGNQIQPQKTKACLKARRWVCDIDAGLQKVYYKENIIASIYALADWFSPSDIEAPTLEWVEFFDRKTGRAMRIEDVPDIIFSEVMRDVDLAVSVAHAGGVDPEASHSTIEMRRAIVAFTLPLFKLKNVRLEGSHAFISGERADYAIHLGSGVVHLQGGPMVNVLPVHSQHRGKLFLPFVDDDPKTAQIISEILLFAEDKKIKDPFILKQL